MTLQEKQIEFIELFDQLDSWADKFQYLIEIGNELEDIPGHLKTLENIITHCQARTYFRATNVDGKIHIDGWSNAAVVSGLVAMLKQIFEGCYIQDLQATPIRIHQATDLVDNMTVQRVATLEEMIYRITKLC